jgi:hypothetical protein
MRRIVFSAAFLLILASTFGETAAQQSSACTLKLSQAPAVRGVKLDMKVDDFLSLFPGSSEHDFIKSQLAMADVYPHFGETSFSVIPANYSTRDQFAGVTDYMVRLFDRRIVGLDVYYESFPRGARWRSADDLIQRFSDSLRLPGPKEWIPEPGNSRKRLRCDGFEIVVSSGERAVISFSQRSWVNTQQERRDAFEEQRRRDFKP